MIILRDDTRFLVRAKADDTGKINAIYISKNYYKHLTNLRDSPIIIDIGAHIGIFSIFAVKRLAKNATVYSYEPFNESFELLQKNIQLNNAHRNVHAFNLAIGGKKGIRKLFLDKTNPGGNSFFFETPDFVWVNAISLKDVFDENNIAYCDFIKMDCEGAEYEILYNTPKEYLDRIKIISMEYHTNEDIYELIKFLKDNGFGLTIKDDKGYFLYAERR